MECYGVLRCLNYIKLANSAMLDVEIIKDLKPLRIDIVYCRDTLI